MNIGSNPIWPTAWEAELHLRKYDMKYIISVTGTDHLFYTNFETKVFCNSLFIECKWEDGEPIFIQESHVISVTEVKE